MKFSIGVVLLILLYWMFGGGTAKSSDFKKIEVLLPSEFKAFSPENPFIFNGKNPEKGKDWIFGFWLKLPPKFFGRDLKLIFSKFGTSSGMGYGIGSDSVSSFPEVAWYNGVVNKYKLADVSITSSKWYYHCLHYSSNGKLGMAIIDEEGNISSQGFVPLPNVVPDNNDNFTFPGQNSNITGAIASPIILRGKLSKSWLRNCAAASKGSYDSKLEKFKD